MNRNRVESERLRERRAKEEREAKEEAAAADKQRLQRHVTERERLRKARAGISLESPEERAAAAAAKGREEYRRRRQANQQRVSAALQRRPSLLERHSQEMEKQAAADRALGIVGDAMVVKAVTSGRSAGKGHSDGRTYLGESKGEGKCDDDDYGDDFEGESKSKEWDDRYENLPIEKRGQKDYRRGLLGSSEQWKTGMRDTE